MHLFAEEASLRAGIDCAVQRGRYVDRVWPFLSPRWPDREHAARGDAENAGPKRGELRRAPKCQDSSERTRQTSAEVSWVRLPHYHHARDDVHILCMTR